MPTLSLAGEAWMKYLINCPTSVRKLCATWSRIDEDTIGKEGSITHADAYVLASIRVCPGVDPPQNPSNSGRSPITVSPSRVPQPPNTPVMVAGSYEVRREICSFPPMAPSGESSCERENGLQSAGELGVRFAVLVDKLPEVTESKVDYESYCCVT
uniref:Ras-GEF domain-containing protein n=1 Tax=Panagrellus redivivus TaxID=6233 RepID=A0A7E4W152_PANRE